LAAHACRCLAAHAAAHASRCGLADQAILPGTRLRVGQLGEGVYERFEKRKIGANRHHIRFASGLEKVELKKLQPALWSIVAEGTAEPEPEPAPAAADPEPEQEAAEAAEEAEPPELDAWLAQAGLGQYGPQLKEYGYDSLNVLQVATEAHIVEMTEDTDIGMKKPHRQLFLTQWQALGAAAGASVLPLSQRTFASSNFKAVYDKTPVPTGPLELGAALQNVLREYCEAEGVDWPSEGQRFFGELQSEAMKNSGELAEADMIPIAAQRMWTSALSLAGREFCFIVNYAGRQDTPRFVEPLAVLSRAINKNCVTERGPAAAATVQRHPSGNVCFRGGGFLDDHRGFFAAGQKFRQPAFLATSFSRGVAENFIRMRGGDDCVLWTIRIDPERKCKHVNLVTKTNVEGEQEYLFAPYSAFTVLTAAWSEGTIASPHTIELLAAVDNKDEPEDLPLAPWS
jgi:hypothetical protein